MSRINLKTHTGNRIVVEFDGKEVGAVQSVRVNFSVGLEDVSGIGDIHVIEHAPTKAITGVTVQGMTLFKKNLTDQGIAIENGDAALAGRVFDLVVYSKDTGERLKTIYGMSFDSGDLDIGAHRVVMQSATFKALDQSGTAL